MTLLSKPWWELALLGVSLSACICGVTWFIVKFLRSSIRFSKKGVTIEENVPYNGVERRNPENNAFSEYLEYCQILREFNIHIKNYFRLWCLENGFDTMTDDKWVVYRKAKVEFVGMTSYKHITECCAHFKSESIREFLKNSDKSSTFMETAVVGLLDDLRKIATEQYAKIAIKKKQVDSYMVEAEKKIRENQQGSVVEILLTVGRMMVELHEMQNRELVKKQMTKVEEVLLNVYNNMSVTYLEIVTTKSFTPPEAK